MTDDSQGLGREIRQLREDLRGRLDAIQTQFSTFLPREVYEAHRAALQRQVDTLERDMERLETEIEAVDERRLVARRWAISAIVVPVLSIVVGIILFALRP